MVSYIFPKDFLWGTATSSYQTEGNNTKSNWWEWEKNKPYDQKYPLEHSSLACDSYNRYEEDFDLCTQLNNNAIRISLEWSRIEPEEGKFDRNEIEHYRKVLLAAKQRNLKTFVTLYHFTSPIWFTKMGGWEKWISAEKFLEYVKVCVDEFKDYTAAFITINEPQVYAFMSYTMGVWPPCKKSYILTPLVQINLMKTHRRAYRLIKSLCNIPVGISESVMWYDTDPYYTKVLDLMAAKTLYFINDTFFLRPVANHLDFIGLNYYFTARVKNLRINSPTDYVSDLGWWINPYGLENILTDLKKYKLPIYITENGIADSKDKYRKQFIRDMLISCAKAINKGVDIKGYFYWSLIDNFEWHQGYWPKFGLVEIDRDHNLQRKPRDSFYYYADICKNSMVNV